MNFKKSHRVPKLRGFTILEITVVMVITGIVMGLGYSGYLLIQKSVYQNQKEQSEINEIAKFKDLLENSFYHSDKVIWNKDKNQLVFDTNDFIELQDSFTIYSKNVQDTIWISTSSITIENMTTFRGEELVNKFSCNLEIIECELDIIKDYSNYQISGLEWN